MSGLSKHDPSMAATRERGRANAADPENPHGIRDWTVEPPYSLPTEAGLYEKFRQAQPRTEGGRPIPNDEPPREPIPGVRLVPDLDGVNHWTDPYGACILAGVSRRTIYAWKNRGWLKIRYMASAKLEIRVDSLWWSTEEREAHARPSPTVSAPVGDHPSEAARRDWEDATSDGDPSDHHLDTADLDGGAGEIIDTE